MSGTRKMEKFELDAYTKAREGEPTGDDAAQPGARTAPLGAAAEGAPRASDAGNAGGVDLPALPFDARPASGGAGPADLPALPFDARPASGAAGPADLPALPFDGRSASGSGGAGPANLSAASSGGRGADVPLAVSGGQRSGLATPEAAGEGWVPGEWIPPQQVEGAQHGGRRLDELDAEALRTRLARKFVTLADSVTEAFRDFSIGAGAYAVELTAPQGMSTGGGKQALQHLRLRPRREGYSVLVAGTVNQVERRAELRDYDHVAVVNEVRFRQAVDVTHQEWEQLLRKAEVVLNAAGIQSMRTPPPRELLDQRRSMQRVSKNAIVALAVVLVLASIVAWRVFVALRADG